MVTGVIQRRVAALGISRAVPRSAGACMTMIRRADSPVRDPVLSRLGGPRYFSGADDGHDVHHLYCHPLPDEPGELGPALSAEERDVGWH